MMMTWLILSPKEIPLVWFGDKYGSVLELEKEVKFVFVVVDGLELPN